MKKSLKTSKGPATVLIVEDNPTQSTQLQYLLEQHGYIVLAAANGQQALSLLKKQKPAIIICDIIMAGMTGFELCKQVKSNRDTSDIPVLLMTSLDSDEEVLEGLACGANSFITKQYKENHLISQVGKILAGQKVQHDDRVQVRFDVQFSGKKRSVTADQQQMLTLLLSTYEAAVQKNTELVKTQDELKSLNERLEYLVQERTAALSAEIEVRKKGEEQIQHLNQVLRAIRNVNQLIVHEKELTRLIQQTCNLLIESRGYHGAWLAVYGNDGPLGGLAQSGWGDTFAPFAKQLAEGGLPLCQKQAAIAENGLAVLRPEKTCGQCPLRFHYGGDQAATVVLRHAGKDYGILGVSLPKVVRMDEEEAGLLEEVAGDIAFALYGMETEKKRDSMYKSLQESEVRYRRLFEIAREGILILDAETGMIIDANPFLMELLHYTQLQFREKTIWELGLLKGIITDRDKFLELQRRGYIRYDDLSLETADGLHVDVEFVSNAYQAGNKKVIQCNIRDTTARKRLEKERENMRVQLLQSQKMEAIGTLAGGVAHDFNNVLTIIQGNTDLLMMDMGEGHQSYADLLQIKQATERAGRLTRQLLLFSRKQHFEFTELDFNLTVDELLKLLKRLIGENIEVVTDLEDNLPVVQADPASIEQIVMNLAVNARDAMPGGGKLYIRTRSVNLNDAKCKTIPYSRPGDFVCFAITDTGCGMNEETLQHIFEPFFTTKEVGKGTGLGLAVVYGIVREHSGWINAFSEPGHGTTFRCYFPAIKRGADSKGKQRKSQAVKNLAGTGEKVLVVEDDAGVRRVALAILGSRGYSTIEASTVREALTIFTKESDEIRVLFCDVVLPDGSGVDLAEKLIKMKPDLKVLLASGYKDIRAKFEAIAEKGYPFLQKPYTSHDLLSKLKEAK